MLNILEENARLLNQIEVNILTSQVGLLFLSFFFLEPFVSFLYDASYNLANSV